MKSLPVSHLILAALLGTFTVLMPAGSRAAALAFVQSFGTAGAGSGQFGYMNGVAVDGSGKVYVADGNNSRIVRFDGANFAGTFTAFGSPGTGNGQFFNPVGLAVDGAGIVYVADNANHRIVSFNPANFAGTFTTFGSNGTGNGQFKNPGAVALDKFGNLWVADGGNNRIVQLSGATPTPEPGSAALLLCGGALLALRRRRS